MIINNFYLYNIAQIYIDIMTIFANIDDILSFPLNTYKITANFIVIACLLTDVLFIFQNIKIQRIILYKINRFGNLGVHHLVDAHEFYLIAVFGDELFDDG